MNFYTVSPARFGSQGQVKRPFSPMSSLQKSTAPKDSVHFGNQHKYSLFPASNPDYFQGIQIEGTKHYIDLSSPEVPRRSPDGTESALLYFLYNSEDLNLDPVGKIVYDYQYPHEKKWSVYKLGRGAWTTLNPRG